LGPLILFVAVAALGLPFAVARPTPSRAYALVLAATGALALTQTAPEWLLLSHKLQLAVQLQVSEWSPMLGLGLVGAVMTRPSPRLWAAAALGLCAALSMNPAFTALSLGLCAFGLSERAAPAAWVAALSLWAGLWAGEGSAAVSLVGGVVLVACALGQPGERVAALVAAGLFTVASPHAALTETGALGLARHRRALGSGGLDRSPWMATLAVGLTLANLGEPGLGLSLMVAGLLPEPDPQAPRALLTPHERRRLRPRPARLGRGFRPRPGAHPAPRRWALGAAQPAARAAPVEPPRPVCRLGGAAPSLGA
jgi:hypothetical protein